MTRRDIEIILWEWQRRLKLTHWRITINWDEPPEHEDSLADNTAPAHYDEAILRLHKEWPKWELRDANVTLVHELLHLVLRDLRAAVTTLEPEFSPAVWAVWFDRYDTGNERAIEHLAQVLVDLSGCAE